MDIRQVTKNVSVAPQILPEEVAELRAQGFKSIICNRPDGGGSDQPNFSEVEAEAQKHGIETLYLPVTSGKVTDEDAESLKAALREMPSPMLAYCRSGTRSIEVGIIFRTVCV